MNVEEWTAHIDGTLHTMILATSSLLATHPEREKLAIVLQALAEGAEDHPDDSGQSRAFKAAVRKAVATMLQGIATSQQAELRRNTVKPSRDN
nr:hypothetical protein [uncultured Holophaga sp.]